MSFSTKGQFSPRAAAAPRAADGKGGSFAEQWANAKPWERHTTYALLGVVGILFIGAIGVGVYSLATDGAVSSFAKATCSSGSDCSVYRGEAACVSTVDKIEYQKEIFVWSRSVAEARPAIAAHAPDCAVGAVAFYSEHGPMSRGKQKLGREVYDSLKD